MRSRLDNILRQLKQQHFQIYQDATPVRTGLTKDTEIVTNLLNSGYEIKTTTSYAKYILGDNPRMKKNKDWASIAGDKCIRLAKQKLKGTITKE